MQTTANAANFVAYPQMVENLFKNLDTPAQTLHHATTGMAGETAEILEVHRVMRGQQSPVDLKVLNNFALELGDWRFYMQKVWNIYGWEWDSFVLPMPGSMGSVWIAIENLIIHSGAVLDLSKKDWIYGKEVDARDLFEQMEAALAAYNEIIWTFGWTDAYVCERNADKLAKRFPNGVYSNADAIARADKADEFQPRVPAGALTAGTHAYPDENNNPAFDNLGPQ